MPFGRCSPISLFLTRNYIPFVKLIIRLYVIDNESYFSQLVFYIHANPQIHGLVADFRDWNWSSYHRMIASKQSALRKEEVIDWFGNIDEYKAFHKRNHQIERNIIIEDDL